MRVIWSPEAEEDRREIVDYIWNDNPIAAEKIGNLLYAAARRLESHPMIGRPSDLPGLRELIPHSSWRVVYEIQDGQVVIHAIVHTSRQWPPLHDEAD